MIVLGYFLIAGGNDYNNIDGLLTLTLSGLLGLISGIIMICSRKKHDLLKISGIMLLISAGINFFGILDISIYSILAVVFCILNLIYCNKI